MTSGLSSMTCSSVYVLRFHELSSCLLSWGSGYGPAPMPLMCLFYRVAAVGEEGPGMSYMFFSKNRPFPFHYFMQFGVRFLTLDPDCHSSNRCPTWWRKGPDLNKLCLNQPVVPVSIIHLLFSLSGGVSKLTS
ncbi:hypothetical protein Tco_1147142 [Tanacetum coccineum]